MKNGWQSNYELVWPYVASLKNPDHTCTQSTKVKHLDVKWSTFNTSKSNYCLYLIYLHAIMFEIFQRFFFRNIGAILTYAFVGTTVSCMVFGWVASMWKVLYFMPWNIHCNTSNKYLLLHKDTGVHVHLHVWNTETSLLGIYTYKSDEVWQNSIDCI